MATQKPGGWVQSLIMRFDSQLPIRTGLHTAQSIQNVEQNKECLINVSKYKFSVVINGLTKTLQSVDSMRIYGPEAERNFYESQIIILDTLEQVLNSQPKDTTRLDETMYVKLLLPEICKVNHLCKFLNISNESQLVLQLKNLASKVLFALSLNNFGAVFNRISARLANIATLNEETTDHTDLELIQHINVDCARLTKLLNEVVNKFKTLRKNVQLILAQSLERSIWNWMENYPEEFTELQQRPSDELAECCDKLFESYNSFCENSMKRKAVVWPLQMMLLVLCPKILEEITNAETGAPCSPNHFRKKQYIEEVKKSLTSGHHGTHKQLTEGAAVTCVKLCKASTYVNIKDRTNVLFHLVQSVLSDLKVLLFNPGKPFSRGQSLASQDVDLMVDCFLSCFRINPHNNDLLKVCLQTHAVPTFHFVLVNVLYRIITQPRLEWWPSIEVIYGKASELRNMFTETLNKVTQQMTHGRVGILPFSQTMKDKVGFKFKEKNPDDALSYRYLLLWMVRLINSDPLLMLHNPGKAGHEVQTSTLELINGLVSLVHQQNMPDVAQEAMDALLCLHEPEIIEIWNPETPILSFWEISSRVLFSISQKLIQHQIVNYTEILKWLQEIMMCRNQFLLRRKDYANTGANLRICKQAQIKLEIVFFLYLWSIDIDAVLTAMSCFHLLCEESDIRGGDDSTQTLPNYSVYGELATSSTVLTTGRAVLQKRIMALLRKVDIQTLGNKHAWEDTFNTWEYATKLLTNYPKSITMPTSSKTEDPAGSVSETLHRPGGKRRGGQQSTTDHELEDQLNEWANMTGFLCALGSVCLQKSSVNSSVTPLVPTTSITTINTPKKKKVPTATLR